ncbi:TolB family protein [Spirosoma montaniterrae]|uniref:S9 family peptidase n=1 Tax=Spirosoma montaniterrae TaxID=1178516 RepID=A0A1P9WRV2_9BACT|nr:hypothetical protein [Spirosoma montaniterrae]AQG78105.1 hypothetical protein AWR27_01300 [Spirosoma montaniterrae]
MRTRFFVLSLWLTTLPLFAQNGTEIYLVDLTEKAGRLAVANPRNISNKPGYDNQPFFHPAKPVLYYTSMMANNQTDIWAYDLKTGTRTQLTQTPDAEYSPTVLPGLSHLSCIVQRKSNGDQDLVSYQLDKPAITEILLESQKTGKIGYQAWLNANEAVVFVLGEPNSMHYLNKSAGQDTVIASQIGRSLHRIPGQNAFSFVQQVGSSWKIRAFEPGRNQIRDIADSHPDSEHYHAWTDAGTLLESRGNELWRFDATTRQWQPVPLPTTLPRKKLSRLAVQGKTLAIVLDE